MLNEQTASRMGTASSNIHSRQQIASGARLSSPPSSKGCKDIWIGQDDITDSSGGPKSSGGDPSRKLTTCESRNYEIIDVSHRKQQIGFPENQQNSLSSKVKTENVSQDREKTSQNFPSIVGIHRMSAPDRMFVFPDRRVFPHRDRINALIKKNLDIKQSPIPYENVERPGSGWTQRTAFEEMLQLRNELALLRSEIKEEKESSSSCLGRSKQKPGMIYAHRVIPISHVD